MKITEQLQQTPTRLIYVVLASFGCSWYFKLMLPAIIGMFLLISYKFFLDVVIPNYMKYIIRCYCDPKSKNEVITIIKQKFNIKTDEGVDELINDFKKYINQ